MFFGFPTGVTSTISSTLPAMSKTPYSFVHWDNSPVVTAAPISCAFPARRGSCVMVSLICPKTMGGCEFCLLSLHLPDSLVPPYGRTSGNVVAPGATFCPAGPTQALYHSTRVHNLLSALAQAVSAMF